MFKSDLNCKCIFLLSKDSKNAAKEIRLLFKRLNFLHAPRSLDQRSAADRVSAIDMSVCANSQGAELGGCGETPFFRTRRASDGKRFARKSRAPRLPGTVCRSVPKSSERSPWSTRMAIDSGPSEAPCFLQVAWSGASTGLDDE